MAKHTIFDNYNYNEEDYRESFQDYCSYNYIAPSEEEFYEFINNELFNQWEDEFNYNLNQDADCDIIAIADLGFWNGRRNGYKTFKNRNIGEIISSCFSDDEDYREIYVEDNEVKGNGHHHDGTHHYIWRLIKKNASESDIDTLKSQIFNNEDYSELLEKCTESLAPTLKKIYGWTD